MASGFPKDDQGRLLPLGDGDLQAGKWNMALLRKALERSSVDYDPDVFASIKDQMLRILTDSANERNRIAAGRLLATLQKLDLDFDKHTADMLKGPAPSEDGDVNGDADTSPDKIAEIAAVLASGDVAIEGESGDTAKSVAGDEATGT